MRRWHTAGEGSELCRTKGHLLPISRESVTLYITQCDVRTSLEYGKVDAWVFFTTCPELFPSLLGLTEMSVPGVFQTEAQPVLFTPNPQCLPSFRYAGKRRPGVLLGGPSCPRPLRFPQGLVPLMLWLCVGAGVSA